MSSVKEKIERELSKSEAELRAELEMVNNSNYRHQLFGELLSFEKIKLFLSGLSTSEKIDNSNTNNSKIPKNVKNFIDDAKKGEKYKLNHEVLDLKEMDVCSVIHYIINEEITSDNIKDWVNKNIDLFAKEWLSKWFSPTGAQSYITLYCMN